MTIGSRWRQSRICVNGCQTKRRSNCAREGKSSVGDKVQGAQGRQQQINIGPAVGRRHSQAQACLPARDGRKAHGGDEHSLVHQRVRDLHRPGLLADHHRDDGPALAIDVMREGGHIGPKLIAAFFARPALDQPHASRGFAAAAPAGTDAVENRNVRARLIR